MIIGKIPTKIAFIKTQLKHLHLAMNAHTQYGPYLIKNICLQTLPCQHYVTDTRTGKTTLMLATDVLRLLDAEKITAPHFEVYRARLQQ